MKIRLYHHRLRGLCASTHLSVLPLGIVVELYKILYRIIESSYRIFKQTQRSVAVMAK